MFDEEPDAPTHGECALEIERLTNALNRSEKERKRLQAIYDEATTVQGDDEVLKYVTSGNIVPVSRCNVSADLIHQLLDRASHAYVQGFGEATQFANFKIDKLANRVAALEFELSVLG